MISSDEDEHGNIKEHKKPFTNEKKITTDFDGHSIQIVKPILPKVKLFTPKVVIDRQRTANSELSKQGSPSSRRLKEQDNTPRKAVVRRGKKNISDAEKTAARVAKMDLGLNTAFEEAEDLTNVNLLAKYEDQLILKY